MLSKKRSWSWPMVIVGAMFGVVVACGSPQNGSSAFNDGVGTDSGPSTGNGDGDSGGPTFGGGTDGAPASTQPFNVAPVATQTITVTAGTKTPTVVFTATQAGNPADAKWQVDRGDLGSITPGPTSTGIFTPSGTTGGTATITASYGTQTQEANHRRQSQRATKRRDRRAARPGRDHRRAAHRRWRHRRRRRRRTGRSRHGSRDACRARCTDQRRLHAKSEDALSVQRDGVAARNSRAGAPVGLAHRRRRRSADRISRPRRATTHGPGTFSPPTILAGGKFIRHPIPQDVWTAATNSAGGTDKLTLQVTVAKAGLGYGPMTQTWSVAPGLLSRRHLLQLVRYAARAELHRRSRR